MPRTVQMSNEVVFAAAGNGKTYSICRKAMNAVNDGNKCVLLISYTNEGIRSLENEYRKQNNGVLDDNVVVKSWYSFLLSEFIKPYQCLLKLKEKRYKYENPITLPENFVTSIAFYEDEPPRYFNQTHVQYYINRAGDVVPDRTSQLAILCNEHSNGKAISRMASIYSHVFIDELQDYAGWDLEIIRLLFESQLQILCVGDYKQATYRTNNSQKNRQYRDERIRDFFVMLEQDRLCCVSYANTTKRFNQEICDFINTIHADENTMISAEPNMAHETQPDNIGVYLIDLKYLSIYCDHYHPVILRYDKNVKIGFKHDCAVFNYGGSKGATYERTVILPVSTTVPFIEEQTQINSNRTRSKFYVACTRAKHSVVIAMETPKENDYFKAIHLRFANNVIPALKFSRI